MNMKNRKTAYIFGAFVVLALVQLFVPANMILNREQVLKSGVAYKFKTRPIDPNDPFRGKYITLDYELNSFETKDTTWVSGQPFYLYLKNDSLGYATIDTISKIVLKEKNDYIKSKVARYYYAGNDVNFDLPFDRFYMEETKAYDAEVLTRAAVRDTSKTTYALVYIKAGEAVLADVLVNNVSVIDLVEKKKEALIK